MGSLQTVVRDGIASGTIGDLVIKGPKWGTSATLNSTSAENNVIGRAVRHIAGKNGEVSADAPAGSVFAGILANSKAYATISGRLDPSMMLPNGTAVELLHGMAGMVVEISTTANIGDNLFYATATGILAANPNGTIPGHERIQGASVIRCDVTGGDNNLAVIQIVPTQAQAQAAADTESKASSKKAP